MTDRETVSDIAQAALKTIRAAAAHGICLLHGTERRRGESVSVRAGLLLPMAAMALAATSGLSMAADLPFLQPMTSMQVMAAGAAGTGCSWSLPRDKRMRFAVADDRAVIRIDGKTVALVPAKHARELFPFTFADWQAEGIVIRVRQIGATRWSGSEASTARATLTIVSEGTHRRIDGILSCGS